MEEDAGSVFMKKRLATAAAWLILGAFLILAILEFYPGVILLGNAPSFESKRFLVFLVGLLLLAAAWLYGLWACWAGIKPRIIASLQLVVERISLPVRGILSFILVLIPSIAFIFSSFGLYDTGFWFRSTILLAAAFLANFVWMPRLRSINWLLCFATGVTVSGAFFTMSGWLSRITSYPFSLSWSEGNRFWDYSIPFASYRYFHPDSSPIFTFISSGRQLLWAVVYLIPNVQIWGVRLWDAMTWIVFPLGLGWAVVFRRGLARPDWIWKTVFVLWTFLFLSQGPIYAPLLVCAILVVVAVRQRSLVVSIILVVLAAYYANLSRWTWTYAPGLWAGLLALLDMKEPGFQKGRLKEFLRPVILGLSGYFGGQVLPQLVAWLQPGSQGIALLIDPSRNLSRQPLLWDRLWPNTTYGPGILLGTFWAGLPVVVLLAWLAWKRIWKVNFLQLAAMVFIGLAFYGVGLVASTKIGGGSNLHNLDMFWITLVMVAGWALSELAPNYGRSGSTRRAAAGLLCVVLVSPALFAIQYGSPLVLPKKELIVSVLDGIRKSVSLAQQKGEVLFLDQRQLLTFDQVQGVPLVVEYEKKFLMDQALAGNAAYFTGFYQDLAKKRFTLIVSEPVAVKLQGKGVVFGDENDAYVHWVSGPLSCYYEPLTTYEEVSVQLLVPRQEPLRDPKICPAP